jgi:EpsI family protein
MKLHLKSLVLLFLMIVAFAAATFLRPTYIIAEHGRKVNLNDMVPFAFGEWREMKLTNGQIINPQQTEELNRIYTQTLARTYINSSGEIVMLSIAYGANQSDGVALHYPEVCYPAQGFALLSNKPGILETSFGNIRVRRLMTKLRDRSEPVTYWTTLGEHVVQGGIDTKITQLKYGFKGQIPDGLLFRVSSITEDAENAYSTQKNFVDSLIVALSSENRLKLAGFSATSVGG